MKPIPAIVIRYVVVAILSFYAGVEVSSRVMYASISVAHLQNGVPDELQHREIVSIFFLEKAFWDHILSNPKNFYNISSRDRLNLATHYTEPIDFDKVITKIPEL